MSFLLILILAGIYLSVLCWIVGFLVESNENVGVIAGILVFLAGIFIPIHIILCTNVWWYGEKVVPPEISLSLEEGSSWLINTDSEPLLGEKITQDADGNYFVTLTDHRIYSDDSDKTPDIKITVSPENATIKKADFTLTVKQLAMKNPPSWYGYDSPDLKEQTTTLDQKSTYIINGSKIRFNESSDIEPTTYRITAKKQTGRSICEPNSDTLPIV